MKCLYSPSCPWFLYVGWNEEIKAIQIRNMGDGNTCTENYKNKAVTGDVIAEFHETIKDCPRLKTSQLQKFVLHQLGARVHLKKCIRAKKKIMENVAGNFKQEFRE